MLPRSCHPHNGPEALRHNWRRAFQVAAFHCDRGSDVHMLNTHTMVVMQGVLHLDETHRGAVDDPVPGACVRSHVTGEAARNLSIHIGDQLLVADAAPHIWQVTQMIADVRRGGSLGAGNVMVDSSDLRCMCGARAVFRSRGRCRRAPRRVLGLYVCCDRSGTHTICFDRPTRCNCPGVSLGWQVA